MPIGFSPNQASSNLKRYLQADQQLIGQYQPVIERFVAECKTHHPDMTPEVETALTRYFITYISRGADPGMIAFNELGGRTPVELRVLEDEIPAKLTDTSRARFDQIGQGRSEAARWDRFFPESDNIAVPLATEAKSLRERIDDVIAAHNAEAQQNYQNALQKAADDRGITLDGLREIMQKPPAGMSKEEKGLLKIGGAISEQEVRIKEGMEQLETFNPRTEKWTPGPKLTKLLPVNLLDEFNNAGTTMESRAKAMQATSQSGSAEPTRYGTHGATADQYDPNSMHIVISRDPQRIGEASSGQTWFSCMSERGINFQYLDADIREGSLIAYLVSNEDPHARRPLGRILLKPYSSAGETILVPGKVYGGNDDYRIGDRATMPSKTAAAFQESVSQWVRDNPNKGKTGTFTLKEGLYGDGELEVQTIRDSWTTDDIAEGFRRFREGQLKEFLTEHMAEAQRVEGVQRAFDLDQQEQQAEQKKVNTRYEQRVAEFENSNVMTKSYMRQLKKGALGAVPSLQEIAHATRNMDLAVRSSVESLISTDPQLVINYCWFEKQVGRTIDEEWVKQIAQQHPKSIFDNSIRIIDAIIPDNKEIFEIAARNADPRTLFKNSFGLGTRPYASELFLKAAAADSVAALEFANNYAFQDYAGEVISVAAAADPKNALINSYKYASQPYAGDIIKQAAARMPKEALSSAHGYVEQPYAEKIIRAAARAYPHTALENASAYADKLYAGDVIKAAAAADPEIALIHAEKYANQPYAGDVFKIIAAATPKRLFAGIDKYADQPYIAGVIETAARAADPETAFQYADKYAGQPYAGEILKAAAAKSPGTAFGYADKYEGQPYYDKVIEIAAKAADHKTALDCASKYADQPYAEGIIKAAAAAEPELAFVDAHGYAGQPYAEKILKAAAVLNPRAALGFADRYIGQPYAEGIIRAAALADPGAALRNLSASQACMQHPFVRSVLRMAAQANPETAKSQAESAAYLAKTRPKWRFAQEAIDTAIKDAAEIASISKFRLSDDPEALRHRFDTIDSLELSKFPLARITDGTREYFIKAVSDVQAEAHLKAQNMLPEGSIIQYAKAREISASDLPGDVSGYYRNLGGRKLLLVESVPFDPSMINGLIGQGDGNAHTEALNARLGGKPVTAEEQRQILKELDILSEAGVIHGDLPANMSFLRDENGKLTMHVIDPWPEKIGNHLERDRTDIEGIFEDMQKTGTAEADASVTRKVQPEAQKPKQASAEEPARTWFADKNEEIATATPERKPNGIIERIKRRFGFGHGLNGDPDVGRGVNIDEPGLSDEQGVFPKQPELQARLNAQDAATRVATHGIPASEPATISSTLPHDATINITATAAAGTIHSAEPATTVTPSPASETPRVVATEKPATVSSAHAQGSKLGAGLNVKGAYDDLGRAWNAYQEGKHYQDVAFYTTSAGVNTIGAAGDLSLLPSTGRLASASKFLQRAAIPITVASVGYEVYTIRRENGVDMKEREGEAVALGAAGIGLAGGASALGLGTGGVALVAVGGTYALGYANGKLNELASDPKNPAYNADLITKRNMQGALADEFRKEVTGGQEINWNDKGDLHLYEQFLDSKIAEREDKVREQSSHLPRWMRTEVAMHGAAGGFSLVPMVDNTIKSEAEAAHKWDATNELLKEAQSAKAELRQRRDELTLAENAACGDGYKEMRQTIERLAQSDDKHVKNYMDKYVLGKSGDASTADLSNTKTLDFLEKRLKSEVAYGPLGDYVTNLTPEVRQERLAALQQVQLYRELVKSGKQPTMGLTGGEVKEMSQLTNELQQGAILPPDRYERMAYLSEQAKFGQPESERREMDANIQAYRTAMPLAERVYAKAQDTMAKQQELGSRMQFHQFMTEKGVPLAMMDRHLDNISHMNQLIEEMKSAPGQSREMIGQLNGMQQELTAEAQDGRTRFDQARREYEAAQEQPAAPGTIKLNLPGSSEERFKAHLEATGKDTVASYQQGFNAYVASAQQNATRQLLNGDAAAHRDNASIAQKEQPMEFPMPNGKSRKLSPQESRDINKVQAVASGLGGGKSAAAKELPDRKKKMQELASRAPFNNEVSLTENSPEGMLLPSIVDGARPTHAGGQAATRDNRQGH